MINIVYCPDHTPKIVIAAGASCAGAVHVHADSTKHTCLVVTDVAEDQPGTDRELPMWPHTAADTTVINDADEWHTHLEMYIP